MSLQQLRQDIKRLEALFPKSHKFVQIRKAAIDELVVHFNHPKGKQIIVTANILEDYPQIAPVWFSECEDSVITATLQSLTDAESPCNILTQVHDLTLNLCQYFEIAPPSELSDLKSSYMDECDEGMESDIDMSSLQNCSKSVDDDEMLEEGKVVLERLNQAQVRQHVSGTIAGSVTATDRLMKELREIYKSEHYKKGIHIFHPYFLKLMIYLLYSLSVYSIELIDDSLYNWHVRLKKVDPDSHLAMDLKTLYNTENQDHLLFQFLFKDTFPFEPPFVRLVSPMIQNGFILNGGALCMEILTKQGWSSAYSLENLILQIAATLVKGKARIQFDIKGQYSLQKAQTSFNSLVQIHAKSGWFTPPKADG
ncbi:unnamed protein product [Dracunculus medinensis]|uniref:UBIQUITIN_CONJUGAT_2 domain-containing protein n=1 Tax=Dracunculus medinensis TaxID=318479 RepID=A0A0N4UI94_DRAME|nr:unnamed protein product [Dracunculus medinensis]